MNPSEPRLAEALRRREALSTVPKAARLAATALMSLLVVACMVSIAMLVRQ